MDLEDTKENIQPLRGGRLVDQLEMALTTDHILDDEGQKFEARIESYEGDDPLSLWYEYLCWLEQANPSGTKPQTLEKVLKRCVETFENDIRYSQDRRFIRFCIKFIDTQPSPVELYQQLYSRGIGTLCADLYIGWAFYYDAMSNFSRAEEIYQKGFDAGAKPKEDLQQAHTAFGFSMSQRLLHNDEESKMKFKTSLDERRNVLTSLKAIRKKHVGSIRTGLAVRSVLPGVINQENQPPGGYASGNQQSNGVNVFANDAEDAGTSAAVPSNMRSICAMQNETQNIREPGPWTKARHPKNSRLFTDTHQPGFNIPEDEDAYFPPLPVLVDNYTTRGIELPPNFKRTCHPQKPFDVPICAGDPTERGIPMYDKTMLYCAVATRKEEYSPEELRAYRYCLRHEIEMPTFVEPLHRIWACSAEVPIRLHPYHQRENKMVEPPHKNGVDRQNPAPEEYVGIQTKVWEFYKDPKQERSLEEIRMEQWKRGEIKIHIDRKHQDDIITIDMDETYVAPKRVSLAPSRVSMYPLLSEINAQQQVRKSVFPIQRPTNMSNINEENAEDELSRAAASIHIHAVPCEPNDQLAAPESDPLQGCSNVNGKRKSEEQIDLARATKNIDTRGTPAKLSMHNEVVDAAAFVPPLPLAPVAESSKIHIFIDDDDDHAVERHETGNNHYANDSLSTQGFNLFVNNQSTPLGKKAVKKSIIPPQDGSNGKATTAEEPFAGPSTVTKVNDENAVPESLTPPSCTSTSSTNSTCTVPKQLSTIMERSETSTSGGATNKSSVDAQISSPETEPETKINVEPKTVFKMPFMPPKDLLPSAEPIVKDNPFVIHVDSTETMANVPLVRHHDLPEPVGVENVAPTTNAFSQRPESVVKVPLAIKPTVTPMASTTEQPFAIHIDSTETMAKIPLVIKRDLPATIRDKENEGENAIPVVNTEPFLIPDEPTVTNTMAGTYRNISHIPQGQPGANSIASFKMTTESTGTVPLTLVIKQGALPVSGEQKKAHPKPVADNSFLELLNKTPRAMTNSFDLEEFQITPKKKETPPPAPLATNSEAVQLVTGSFLVPSLPAPIMPASKENGKVILNEFPSPVAKRNSLEDVNTAAFSLNFNHIVNSTVIQDFDAPIDFNEIKPPTINNVRGGITLVPPSPLQEMPRRSDYREIPEIIELSDLDSDELENNGWQGKSIYMAKPAVFPKVEERWEEIDEHFSPTNNAYLKKEVDLNCTTQMINRHMGGEDIDPFDSDLLEAFLERVDFTNYLAELSSCSLVNKVQPLKKGTTICVGDEQFEPLKRIGEGSFGTVYSARNLRTKHMMALKQERPANLWEYYICLELRSRIVNLDILPGLMSVDYAIVGNNASILISSFSKYGNILDVCNVIKNVTGKTVDEFIAMVITAQILSIIDHLHSCQIIHADIKPDNFLLMCPVDLDPNKICVQLIDFGVSIDMKLFGPNTTFKRVVSTKGFTCIEMLEGRPWTYQPDLYGVAATSHVILFGRYMEVQKEVLNWNIKSRMPRYFKKAIWNNYFSTMLNIRDCKHLPCLQHLRAMFLQEIEVHEKYIHEKVTEFNNALQSSF